jgi:hypothetical protein
MDRHLRSTLPGHRAEVASIGPLDVPETGSKVLVERVQMDPHMPRVGVYRRHRHRRLLKVRPSADQPAKRAPMTNDFTVTTAEILLVDEPKFRRAGGEELWFGQVEGSSVQLHASGSRAAICCLAHEIMSHHTASH